MECTCTIVYCTITVRVDEEEKLQQARKEACQKALDKVHTLVYRLHELVLYILSPEEFVMHIDNYMQDSSTVE